MFFCHSICFLFHFEERSWFCFDENVFEKFFEVFFLLGFCLEERTFWEVFEVFFLFDTHAGISVDGIPWLMRGGGIKRGLNWKSSCLLGTYEILKNYNDQTYSCPRDASLSASYGTYWGPKLKSLWHHSPMVSRVSSGTLDWPSMMPRDAISSNSWWCVMCQLSNFYQSWHGSLIMTLNNYSCLLVL